MKQLVPKFSSSQPLNTGAGADCDGRNTAGDFFTGRNAAVLSSGCAAGYFTCP